MCVTAYVEGDIIHKDGCLSVFDRERYFCPVRLARSDAHRPRPVNGRRLSTKGSPVRRTKKWPSPPQAEIANLLIWVKVSIFGVS